MFHIDNYLRVYTEQEIKAYVKAQNNLAARINPHIEDLKQFVESGYKLTSNSSLFAKDQKRLIEVIGGVGYWDENNSVSLSINKSKIIVTSKGRGGVSRTKEMFLDWLASISTESILDEVSEIAKNNERIKANEQIKELEKQISAIKSKFN